MIASQEDMACADLFDGLDEWVNGFDGPDVWMNGFDGPDVWVNGFDGPDVWVNGFDGPDVSKGHFLVNKLSYALFKTTMQLLLSFWLLCNTLRPS